VTAKNQDFEMYQGENKVIDFDTYDKLGNEKDLTGAEAKWVLFGGANSLNKIEKTTQDNEIIIIGKKARVILIPSDTNDLGGRYRHELRVVDGVGNSEVTAVGVGTIFQSQTG
jgi:hypothetical protein